MTETVKPSRRTKLARRLDIQAQHEGESAVKDCRLVLAALSDLSEWTALTRPRHHRYGKLSYEVHIFYDLKPMVRKICAALA